MPETQSKVLSAPVYWAQRSNLVYVKIGVEDVKSPEVKVDKNKIYFKAVGSGKQEYEADLELFDEINTEESKFIVRDRGTEFVLIKANVGPYWKRLLKSDSKFHWLKVDFNKWKDEDDTDDEGGAPGQGGGDFEEMMRQMGGLGGMGGAGMPDLGDLDDKDDEPDSDDGDLPELEDK
ncbi:co-chaperone protein daf-41-like [Oppia nitens]|uniref:co-chaperone protein daf-41-like n=1 Tax=Oppia nitens TaxID=1686743 RepID=UPI0023DA9560|nr:co-chaperone protein daf-41-like [Oppia nitens]